MPGYRRPAYVREAIERENRRKRWNDKLVEQPPRPDETLSKREVVLRAAMETLAMGAYPTANFLSQKFGLSAYASQTILSELRREGVIPKLPGSRVISESNRLHLYGRAREPLGEGVTLKSKVEEAAMKILEAGGYPTGSLIKMLYNLPLMSSANILTDLRKAGKIPESPACGIVRAMNRKLIGGQG